MEKINYFAKFEKSLAKLLNAKKIHLREKFKITVPEKYFRDHVGPDWWGYMISCENISSCHIEVIELFHEKIRLVYIAGTRWYV